MSSIGAYLSYVLGIDAEVGEVLGIIVGLSEVLEMAT
jgi:hypothetical protein